MEKEAQNFLKAEETAEKLVETLRHLHTEASSYQTATQELNTIRAELLHLIESTEKIVGDSHEVIKILKGIGGPEILSRLAKIENILTEEFSKQKSFMDKIKILIMIILIISIVAIIFGILTFLK